MLNFVSRPLDVLEKRLRQATLIDSQSLCLFRVVFGLFILFFKWQSFRWIGTVPEAFYNPPILSLSSLFTDFPHQAFFNGIDFLIAIFTIALLIGLLTRLSTIALLVLLIVANSFQYSLGKIDHGSVLYLCVLLIMSFKDWGRYVSADNFFFYKNRALSSSSKPQENLWLLAVLISFSFFTAGFSKALVWIDFDLSTSGFLSWLYSGYFSFGRTHLLAPFIIGIDLPFLWELVDMSAVIFELGFLAAMFWRKAWYVWLTIACFFHLSNTLLLNIPFNTNAIAYLAFIPWSQLGQFSLDLLSSFRRWSWLLFSCWALTLSLSLSSNHSFSGLAYYIGERFGVPTAGLWISCLLWASCLGLFIWVIVTGRQNYPPPPPLPILKPTSHPQ